MDNRGAVVLMATVIYNSLTSHSSTGNSIMASSAERQTKLREARAVKGIIQVTAWVPAGRAADIKEICAILCDHPDLTAALLTQVRTGKIVSKKKLLSPKMAETRKGEPGAALPAA